jgi:glycosyltransferase involved in cell wall biosynthesis
MKGFMEALPEAFVFDLDNDLDNDLDETEARPVGADAKHGVFLGQLSQLVRARMAGNHERFWAMVAPNSDTIGKTLLDLIEAHATDVLVPSMWAKAVMRDLTRLPVTVVPHGVSWAWAGRHAMLKPPKPSSFQVLHMTSSTGDRKGTKSLMLAWRAAMANGKLPEDSVLRIVCVPEMRITLIELAEDYGISKSVEAMSRLNMPPNYAKGFYKAHDFICQPSRGEGFGMVPLEALASGVPVMATGCTGHSEWAGVIGTPPLLLVNWGECEPIDDFPGAKAPSVQPEDVYKALVRAYEERAEFKVAAESMAARIQTEWSWTAKLAYFKKVLENES